MNIDEAIEMLKAEYEKAEKQKHIHKPVAYALYQTWKEADRKRRKSYGQKST